MMTTDTAPAWWESGGDFTNDPAEAAMWLDMAKAGERSPVTPLYAAPNPVHQAGSQEPVGWLVRGGGPFPVQPDDEWQYRHGPKKPYLAWTHQESMPVYATPPAAPPAPSTVPPDAIDAKRYRWLRQYDVSIWGTGVGIDMGFSPDMLDAAIDEAMGATPPTAPPAPSPLD